MKKTFLTLLVSFAFIASNSCIAAFHEVCLQMPGHWKGTVKLKNKEDCTFFGGCKHSVKGVIKHVANNEYIGRADSGLWHYELTFLCENGQVTNIQGIALTCSNKTCILHYDGPKFSADFNKR